MESILHLENDRVLREKAKTECRENLLKSGKSIAEVDSTLQSRVHNTFARFWQERLVSLENPDIPTVKTFLVAKRFHLSSANYVDPDALPQTRQELLQDACSFFDIQYLLPRQMHTLSNGELRRVLLARAFMQNADCMILEEPTAGLDPLHRRQIKDSLRQLAQRGASIHVFSSSDWEVDSEDQECLFQNPTNRTGIPFIQLRQIDISFGETKIIHNLDWELYAGEKWILKGKNGSGKSSILSLLSGDHPQMYRNDISLFGEKPGQGLSVWDHKAKLGLATPEMHYHWRENGTIVNVIASGFLHPRDPKGILLGEELKQAHKMCEMLSFLPHLLFHDVDFVTQRLALVARAMIARRPLILLDEPDQGLDAIGRKRLWDFINAFDMPTNCILVVASHHLNPIPAFATHVMDLDVFK